MTGSSEAALTKPRLPTHFSFPYQIWYFTQPTRPTSNNRRSQLCWRSRRHLSWMTDIYNCGCCFWAFALNSVTPRVTPHIYEGIYGLRVMAYPAKAWEKKKCLTFDAKHFQEGAWWISAVVVGCLSRECITVRWEFIFSTFMYQPLSLPVMRSWYFF